MIRACKAMFKQIEDRVNALPGVQAASFSAFTFHEGSWNSMIRVPGMPINRNVNVEHNIIGDGFFKTMQIPIVAGRSFGPQDTATSQKVAVISEHTARTLFPAGSPIGRTYFIGSDDGVDPPLEEQVIGVAKDVKVGDLAGAGRRISITFPTRSGTGASATSRFAIQETSAQFPARCSRRFMPSIANCRSLTSRRSRSRSLAPLPTRPSLPSSPLSSRSLRCSYPASDSMA